MWVVFFSDIFSISMPSHFPRIMNCSRNESTRLKSTDKNIFVCIYTHLLFSDDMILVIVRLLYNKLKRVHIDCRHNNISIIFTDSHNYKDSLDGLRKSNECPLIVDIISHFIWCMPFYVWCVLFGADVCVSFSLNFRLENVHFCGRHFVFHWFAHKTSFPSILTSIHERV